MTTVLYLSNNVIRVVEGNRGKKKGSVDREIMAVIPDGSMINGVITNPDELKAELQDFWDEHKLSTKGIHLVVSSSKFVVKQFKVPKVNKKKTEALVPMEFSDVDRYEEAVFDYMQVPSSGTKTMQELLAIMAEKEYIEEYVKLFEELEIELVSFSNALSSIVKTLGTMADLNHATCIIQIVDGSNLESILWVEGKYLQSTNRRVFSEPGTKEFATDVLRHTTNMLQFYKSQNMKNELKDVYLCGVTQSEIEELQELEEQFESGLNLHPFSVPWEASGRGENEKYAEYIHAYGALVQTPKEVNLLNAYKASIIKKGEPNKVMGYVIPVASVLLVGLIASAASFGLYMSKKAELAEVNEYVQNPDNIAISDEVSGYESIMSTNRLVASDVELVDAMIASYPTLNRKVAAQIVAAQGDVTSTLSSYDSTTGALAIEARAASEISVNQYVARLHETGLFDSLQYTGYAFSDGDDSYVFQITGYLLSSAGK